MSRAHYGYGVDHWLRSDFDELRGQAPVYQVRARVVALPQRYAGIVSGRVVTRHGLDNPYASDDALKCQLNRALEDPRIRRGDVVPISQPQPSRTIRQKAA